MSAARAASAGAASSKLLGVHAMDTRGAFVVTQLGEKAMPKLAGGESLVVMPVPREPVVRAARGAFAGVLDG